MKRRILFTIWLLASCFGSVFSQNPDSIRQTQIAVFQQDTIPLDSARLAVDTLAQPDSTQAKKPGFIKRLFLDYPNPNKGLLIAVVVPGGGQIYNKRWWKLPLAYGAYGGMIYLIRYNSRNYRDFRDAYIAEVNGLPHKYSDTRLDAGDLKTLRDSFDKNKQLSYIGLVAVHLVVSVESFVDSHLRTFDVSDDLSLQVKPSFEFSASGEACAGLGLRLQFGR